jgi:hypothetical protein
MVSDGDSHGFVLNANGTVTSWNAGIFETNTPANLTNFISLIAVAPQRRPLG